MKRSTTAADGRPAPLGIGSTRASSGFERRARFAARAETIPGWGGRRSAALRRRVTPAFVVPAQCAALKPPDRAPSRMRNDDVQAVEPSGAGAPGTPRAREDELPAGHPPVEVGRGPAAADPQRGEPARRDES